MPKEYTTDRLTLRPVTQEDFSFFRSLHSDTQVMKYISTGTTRTEEQTRESILKCLEIESVNPLLGAWVAETRDGRSTPIGTLILRRPATKEKTEGLEIGFTFLPAHWGKGFATEASLGLMNYARAHFGEVRFIALIDPANQASRAVLSKLGFVSIGSSEYVDPTTGAIIPTEILEK